MQATVYVTETGWITNLLTSSPNDVPLNTPEGHAWIEGHHDAETKWIDGGEAKDRPALDVAPPALVAGGSWQVALPIGTEIAVVAEDGATETTATTDAEMVEIAFEDAGQWALRLTPPFPYQPAEISIEVTDAD